MAVVCFAAVTRGAPSDPAAADALFYEGRAAMDRGDLAVACSAFERSERLDPAAGTLINWAECLGRQGKVASSWLKWREALESLPPVDERRAGVEERVRGLEGRVPRLELRLAPDVPAGAEVRRDGVVVDPAALGLSIPTDPGEHRISVVAPGRAAWETTVVLAEGEPRTVVVEAGPALARHIEVSAGAPERRAPVLPWVVMGVGTATTIVGASFGILAIVENGRVEDECRRAPGALLCSKAGLDAAHEGHTDAMIANVAVPIGLVAVAAGGYLLWQSGRTPERAQLRAVPVGGGGAMLRFNRAF